MTRPTISVDGYGDRDDIALENDRMLENAPPRPYTRWEDYWADSKAQLNSGAWAGENGLSLLSLAESMIEQGKTHACCRKADYQFMEAEDIRDSICICKGWGTEDCSVELYPHGFDFELTLSYPSEG